MSAIQYLRLDTSRRTPLLKKPYQHEPHENLHVSKTHTRPLGSDGDESGSMYFIGNATTVIEWNGVRILTDPNFLHAGDHVHLGPGVTAERLKNPAVDLDELPPLDVILLSHYHEDHFDRMVEESLNRAFPIITTHHAKDALTRADREEPFEAVSALNPFESVLLRLDPTNGHGIGPVIKVTGMPGKHVPPGPLSVVNDLIQAVPPTNGWLLELGHLRPDKTGVQTGYRIYISGDTLFVDELRQIPAWLQHERIDLMLIHLGGTTIPGPMTPLLMVTMDAKQGLQLMQLVDPDITVPIHFDDYSVFLAPLSDFKKAVGEAGLSDRVVYLDRGDEYRFVVR